MLHSKILSALGARVWRAGSETGHSDVQAVPTRFAALDRLLPDAGWPQRTLIELVGACGVGEMRLLAPVLAPLMRTRQPVALIEPPHILCPRALMAHGVVLEQLLVVRTRQPGQGLWAIEQTLKSGGVAAVVAWLPESSRLVSFQALRRLQLAANRMQCAPGLVFLLRSPAARTAASPAPLRIQLAPCRRGVALEIFKRRGMPVRSVQLALPGPALHLEASFEVPAAQAAEAAIDAVDCRLSA